MKEFASSADEGGENVVLKTLIFAPDARDEMKLDLTGESVLALPCSLCSAVQRYR